MRVVTRQGGQEVSSVEPRPEGEWLTPGQVQRLWERKIAEGVEEITYRMIDAQLGLRPAQVRHKLRGREVYTHEGAELPVTVWDTTTDVMPIPGLEKYTEDGTLVYQEANMGLGTMVTAE